MTARTSFADRDCSAARALEIIGDSWSLLVIRDILYGIRRFDALQQELGISRKVLTQRLKRLVEADILKRCRYQERPDRYEYRLTQKGLELQPILLTLGQWGARWLDGGQAPFEFIHSECGEPARPTTYCTHCDQPITAHSVRVRARDTASEEADRIEACAGREVFLRDR